MKTTVLALAALTTMSAQTGGALAAPGSANMAASASAPAASAAQATHHAGPAGPVLGFVRDSSGTSIRALVGSGSSVQLYQPLALPDCITQVYLPPRQMYALVERAGQPLSRMRLARDSAGGDGLIPFAIASAWPHADRVFFSPRGDSALLWSESSGSLEALSNLNTDAPGIVKMPAASLAALERAAISDDGDVVAVYSPGQGMLYSQAGSDWQTLPAAFTPAAWTFLPQSHKLALFDASQREFALVAVGQGNALQKVMNSRDAYPQRLIARKEGSELLAISQDGRSWLIDFTSTSVMARDAHTEAENAALLRDGYSFLLSAESGVHVLKLNGGDGR